MQYARSLLEAEVFLALQPCVCGECATRWDYTSFAGLSEGRLRVNFEGACRQCGLLGRTHLAIPDCPPERGHFSRPDDGPSPLLDPADWWAIGTKSELGARLTLAQTHAWPLPAGDQFDAWMELAGLLTTSAAAIDEIIRFLPDGAAAVPVQAFRTPLSRELREREAESFTRTRLIAHQAARWCGANDFFAEHPEPAWPADDDDDDAGYDDDISDLRLVRSHEEADLFLSLHPCACGEREMVRSSGVRVPDDPRVIRHFGDCVSCGQFRTFAFRRTEDLCVPDMHTWAGGGEPSELLDAGEWMSLADALLRSHPVDSDALAGPQRAELHRDLALSAAAVDEVLKFLPPDADRVPPSAFWTTRGRAALQAQPDRFDRDVLEASRAALQSRLAGFSRPERASRRPAR